MLSNLPEVTQPIRRGSGLKPKVCALNHHRSVPLNNDFSWVSPAKSSTEHHQPKHQKQQVLAKENSIPCDKP